MGMPLIFFVADKVRSQPADWIGLRYAYGQATSFMSLCETSTPPTQLIDMVGALQKVLVEY
jgi:hypothetical protein